MIYRFSFVKLVTHNSVNRILCWIIALQSIKIINKVKNTVLLK